MRNLKSALNVLKDHVSAVFVFKGYSKKFVSFVSGLGADSIADAFLWNHRIDVDYSPTGEELVTGAYDRTLRIFDARQGHSRDVYHTKRMQRLFCVKYSMDSKYIFSGSDDANIRIWKSNASEKLGPVSLLLRAFLGEGQPVVFLD
jgi:WD repeat and SOF domain-containing protein 1